MSHRSDDDDSECKKRRRSHLIDDDFIDEQGDDELPGKDHDRRIGHRKLWHGIEEVDADEEEEEEEEEEVDSDDEEEEDGDAYEEDDELLGKDHRRRMRRRQLRNLIDEIEEEEEEEEEVDSDEEEEEEDADDGEEPTNVDQQALLPSVQDPKLWMVTCAIGREREAVNCLMQKVRDKGHELQIWSAIALNHKRNCIYVEADKEAHVREACKGVHAISPFTKFRLVPIKEMPNVLSFGSKFYSRKSWVRMKIGTYKGDLAKVVDVDNMLQKVAVKLIPRIDLVALANKMVRNAVTKKKAFVPPQRFMNVEEAREMNLRVERIRDPVSGEYFENINGMIFKDGFLYKLVSMKSISTQNIHPTFDELEKFGQPSESEDEDFVCYSTLFANRKKVHFRKSGQVITVNGHVIYLKEKVQKVEEGNVRIRPNAEGLPTTLAVNEKELCKFFEPGNHVKVVLGASAGATGMVIKVEEHAVIILSDTTKEHLRVFADNVVKSSEVMTGVTRIGDYELHDVVMLDQKTPGGSSLDMMSPAVGGDNGGIWALPDVLVTVHKPGEDYSIGVVREVLPDASCKITLGSSGNGEVIIALPSEIKIVAPRKSNKIKIMGGAQRGATGKLIGVDGSDGIVKVDDTLDVKVLDMNILAKLVHVS